MGGSQVAHECAGEPRGAAPGRAGRARGPGSLRAAHWEAAREHRGGRRRERPNVRAP